MSERKYDEGNIDDNLNAIYHDEGMHGELEMEEEPIEVKISDKTKIFDVGKRAVEAKPLVEEEHHHPVKSAGHIKSLRLLDGN